MTCFHQTASSTIGLVSLRSYTITPRHILGVWDIYQPKYWIVCDLATRLYPNVLTRI